jgi:thiol-disulfide isomerase/thioredoxin
MAANETLIMAAYEAQQTLKLLHTGEASSLAAFRAGQPLVLDFWHTRCVRCPEALSKLDKIAGSGKHAGVVFAACALSTGEGSMEATQELLEDEWEDLTHLFMSVDEKELAKSQFGFSAVPFCVVVAADGSVLYTGDPKDISFDSIFESGKNEIDSEPVLAASPDSVTDPLAEVKRELPPTMPAMGSLVLDDDF